MDRSTRSVTKLLRSTLAATLLLATLAPQLAHADSSLGAGQLIAVIDSSGIDSAAPVLANSVVHEVCLDPALDLISVNPSVHCPNNQALDETRGAATPSYTPSGSLALPNGAHGTQVASVIPPLLPGAKIIAIRYLYQATIALTWIHQNAQKYNITAVVWSEGFPTAPDSRNYLPCIKSYETTNHGQNLPLAPAVQALRDDGLALFFSAGNEGFTDVTDAPACLPGVYAVGASDKSAVAAYSNISPTITILAPGTSKVSTITARGDYTTATSTGTSFATPYLASIFVKVKALYPTLTNDQIIAAMRTTGTLTDDLKVKHIPILNPTALLAYLATTSNLPTLASTLTAQSSSYQATQATPFEQTTTLQSQIQDLQAQVVELKTALATGSPQLTSNSDGTLTIATTPILVVAPQTKLQTPSLKPTLHRITLHKPAPHQTTHLRDQFRVKKTPKK